MRILFTMTLLVAVYVFAINVVVAQHNARKYFVEIQELEKTRDILNEEWGKLQLEQSTWATDDRIESLARTQLGMTEPVGQSLKLLIR